jgi:hypothetical protein
VPWGERNAQKTVDVLIVIDDENAPAELRLRFQIGLSRIVSCVTFRLRGPPGISAAVLTLL